MKDSEVSVDGGVRDYRIPAVTATSESPTIVSIGYEQRDVSELIGLLKANGVVTLVDVRLNPISRKKGFSKKSLGCCAGRCRDRVSPRAGIGKPQGESRSVQARSGVSAAEVQASPSKRCTLCF